VLHELVDQVAEGGEARLQDLEQGNTIILQFVFEFADESVQSKETSIDCLLFTLLQQLGDIVGHEAAPTLGVIELGDRFDASNVLLDNEWLRAQVQLGDDLASELHFVSLFVQNDVLEVFGGDFLCVRLILKLPVELDKRAQLDCGSECELLIDLRVRRNVQESENIPLLFLFLINELLSLLSKVSLRIHTGLEGLHQLLLHV